MKHPCLITTDLHLVDHPSAEYRWSLFPWINQQVKEYGIRSIRILGDLTDAKDNHSASLVNRIADSVKALHCDDVAIMAGNHDWMLKGHEFFRFLNHIPGLRFITSITEEMTPGGGESSIFLPYTKTPDIDWQHIDFGHYDYAFMHQTVKGARASNGQLMDGEGVPPIGVRRQVYSGDIHVPQDIGNVRYVGSPYHVHFGDNFEPRVLVLGRGGRETWLKFPAPKRITKTISSLDGLQDLDAGDQVKLRIALAPEDQHAWAAIKREAVKLLEKQGVIVHGVELQRAAGKSLERIKQSQPGRLSPGELVYRFVQHEELGGGAYDAAMDVLES